jgi:uncharacterized protein (TIGR02391 family)
MSDYLYVEEFLKRIEPFKDVLDSVRINCAAARIKDKWVSLFTRIILTNAHVGEPIRNQIIEPDPNFVGVWTGSNANIASLLEEFQRKGGLEISCHHRSYEVYATKPDAGLASGGPSYRFSPFFEFKRQFSTDSNFRPSVRLQVNCSDRFYGLLTSNDIEVLSRKLRIQTPPINGIHGLLHLMGDGSTLHRSSDQTSWEFVALLPFETNVVRSGIEVLCPGNTIQRLRIVYFFSPGGTATEMGKASANIDERPGWTRGQFSVPWPAKALEANAFLYFEDSSLDELNLHRNERDGAVQEVRQGTFAQRGIVPPISLDSEDIDWTGIASSEELASAPKGPATQYNLHPKIAARCESHFLAGNYDDAIFNAMKAVEEELRQRIKADSSNVGVMLISKAFNAKTPMLSFPPAGTEAEKEALYALFRGAIGMFKNPISHRFVGHRDPDKTYEILAFASLLVRIIEECTSPSQTNP